MTTITIKDDSNIRFQKKVFEDLNDFLNTIRQDVSDYSDLDFKDTIISKDILKKAKKTRKNIEENQDSFFEI